MLVHVLLGVLRIFFFVCVCVYNMYVCCCSCVPLPLACQAANLPPCVRPQSRLVCRVTGALMNENNRPFALPNGNVTAEFEGNPEKERAKESVRALCALTHARTSILPSFADLLVFFGLLPFFFVTRATVGLRLPRPLLPPS